MSPKISVIIPAYNSAHSICRAIDSALIQQDVTVEVIVVNDCSEDLTHKIIQDCYAKTKAVKLLKTATNSGPSYARNMAIDNASGSWVALLDADDWFAQGRLSALYGGALTHELDFIADSYNLSRDQDLSPRSARFTTLSKPGSVTTFTADAFIRHGLGSVKPLINKAFLERSGIRFSTSIWCGEDTLFFVTLLLNNARFGLLNTPFYTRRETADSLSKSNKIKMLADLQNLYQTLQHQTIMGDTDNRKITSALNYRASVVNDALAAARWESWFKNRDTSHLPQLPSLANAVRHLLLRNRRYHNAKLTA